MMLFLRSVKDKPCPSKDIVTYPSCTEGCCISFTIPLLSSCLHKMWWRKRAVWRRPWQCSPADSGGHCRKYQRTQVQKNCGDGRGGCQHTQWNPRLQNTRQRSL